MKLIIEIDEETYNRAKNEPPILCGMNDGLIYQSNMKGAIANGTPYNPTGDLISREALKKVLIEEYEAREHYSGEIMLKVIDNAPTVKPCVNCDLYFIAKTKEEMRKGGAE